MSCVYKGGVHCQLLTRGGGLSDGMKKNTNGALEDKAISKSFEGKINIFVHSPHPRSLSAFVFNLKEKIISRLAIGEH